MPKLAKKEWCTGCGACLCICPQNAVEMREDNQGFWYPWVNEKYCVECGLCTNTCPLLKEEVSFAIPNKVYGLKMLQKEELSACSSGGAFLLFARQILDQGGHVFGAAFTPDLLLEHQEAKDISQVLPLLKSKYLQSRADTVYLRIRELLGDNIPVLFCGTGCQIRGLKSFLQEKAFSPQLFCVAIVCHGVPSPGVWKKYRYEREKQQHAKMTQMDFRSNAGGISLKATFSNGKIINYGAWNDPYVRAFLKDFCLRNCCYDCHAKLAHNDADLTIGDFWGAEKSLPNLMGEDKRLSLVIPQTEKGSVLLQKILPYTMWDTCPIEDGISHNPSIVFSSSKNEKIDIFWKYYCIMPFFKTMNYCEIGGKFEQIRRGLYDRWKSLKSFDFHL